MLYAFKEAWPNSASSPMGKVGKIPKVICIISVMSQGGVCLGG